MNRLSYAQHQIWLSHRISEPSPLYNVPSVLRLTGPLNRHALEAAIRDVIRRHEVLRTVYPDTGGGPRQRIIHPDEARPPLVVTECRESELTEVARRIVRTPFDLAVDIPLRSSLLVLGPEEYVLVLVMHHIAFDGLSMRPFFRDLEHAYAGRLSGRGPSWAELPVQYADFAEWQREVVGDESDPGSLGSRQLSYWRDVLSGLPDELSLPTDRPRPAAVGFRGGAVPLWINASVHTRLIELARAERVTMFMVFHTALAALLTRLGAGTDIPIGTPVAGRPDEKLTDLVGCFNNTIVLRGNTKGDPTLRELLRRLRETDLSALSHQDVPFERVVAALNPPRSASRHPLFQVMLFAESQLAQAGVLLPGVRVRVVRSISTGTAKLDLTVGFAEQYRDNAPAGITGVVEYSAALFDRATAEAIARRLEAMFTLMARHADSPVSAIDLVDDNERRRLLTDWNDTADESPASTVPQRIEAQVAQTPDAVAVECGGTQLRYAELDARANRLARHLHALGAGPETVVAIELQPSELILVAVLAVMKSGAAYLPVDPDSPDRRVRFMLEDAAVRVLVTDTPPPPGVTERGVALCRLDDPTLGETLAGYPDTRPIEGTGPLRPARAAYVIYTSGSTGTPKGVVVEHRSLANYVSWAGAQYRGCRGPALLHSPIAFDLSVTSLLLPLCRGGRVRVGALVPDVPDAPRTTLLKVTPSHLPVLAAFPADREGPDELVVGGEALPADDVAGWRRRHPAAAVINEYGPTEATVGCTAFRLEPGDQGPVGLRMVPIGRPIRNTRVYVLDESMRPAPTGVPGELWVAGASLARGYLGRPGLTAERFVACPFGPPGERMYRTGDLSRWRTNGNLEFLGRTDQQVKLRGYRIEPGEIEAVLRAHPLVDGAAAVLRQDENGEPLLVGYVVSHRADQLSIEELRAFAGQRLTRHMVPAVFLVADVLPLARSGKLDTAAIPRQARPRSAVAHVEPRSSEEATVRDLFAETLGVDRIGVHNSFFDLGGTSIQAAKMLARLATLGFRPVPLHVVYANPTVAELAVVLRGRGVEPPGAVLPVLPTVDIGGIPPRPRQRHRSILLTGATGFFGAFLLDEILRSGTGHVHCLVRAADAAEGYRRLAANLAAYGRGRARLTDRVSVVVGDLAEPRLGLSDGVLDRLSNEIDAIYHNGAAVNALLPYRELEKCNVDATRHIVDLAATSVLKEVHYVSSASAAILDAGAATGEAPSYAATKWASERILVQAAGQGVPTTVFRLPRLVMDSRTLNWNQRDVMARILRLASALGVAPDVRMNEAWIPVDEAARLLVATVTDRPQGGLFQLTTADRVTLARLVEASRTLGRPLTVVPVEDWLKRLTDHEPAEADVLAPILTAVRGERVDSAEPAPSAGFTPVPAEGMSEALLRRYLEAGP